MLVYLGTGACGHRVPPEYPAKYVRPLFTRIPILIRGNTLIMFIKRPQAQGLKEIVVYSGPKLLIHLEISKLPYWLSVGMESLTGDIEILPVFQNGLYGAPSKVNFPQEVTIPGCEISKVTASSLGRLIEVRWESPQSQFYNIYRVDSSQYIPLNSSPIWRGFFIDVNVKMNQEYTYYIRPVTFYAGIPVEGDVCKKVKIRNMPPAPAPPGRVYTVKTGEQVKVVWTPSTSSDVTGYIIYRKCGKRVKKVGVAASTMNSYQTQHMSRCIYGVSSVNSFRRESRIRFEVKQ